MTKVHHLQVPDDDTQESFSALCGSKVQRGHYAGYYLLHKDKCEVGVYCKNCLEILPIWAMSDDYADYCREYDNALHMDLVEEAEWLNSK